METMEVMDRKLEKKRFTTKRILFMAGTVIFILLVGFAYRLSAKKVYDIAGDKITVGEVTYGNFQDVVLQSATVQPLTTVLVNSPEGGTVEKIFVEDGSMVKAGEPLLKINNPGVLLGYMTQEAGLVQQMNQAKGLRLQLEQDQRTIEQSVIDANYNLLTAEQQFKIDTGLYVKGVIARKDYQKSQRDFHYGQAKQELSQQILDDEAKKRAIQLQQINLSISQMEQSLAIIHENIENMTVKAPVSGRLSSFDPMIGRNYGSGESLGKIDVMQGYKLVALVDEYYIARVKEGQQAVCVFGDKEYPMKVKKVLPEVISGQFQVELNFVKDVPADLSRGLSLQVKIFLSNDARALLLPRGQFFESTGGNWVYVVKGHQAVKRNIQLGRKNYQYFEVLDGLEKGDKVITSSYDGYTQYDQINIE